MKFKLSPIQETALFLGAYSLLAIGLNLKEEVFLHLLATVLWAGVLYWIFSFTTAKHKNIWNTLVTSEILFLILHYGGGAQAFWLAFLATTFAVTQKFFFEYKGSPVINPTVFGILVVSVISALSVQLETPFVSWWGVSFAGIGAYLSLGLMLLWILTGLRRWNKVPVILSFLVVNAIAMLLRGESMGSLQFVYTDATLYFLTGIMLIDPKTSPLNRKDQMIFGGVAATALNLFYYLSSPHPAILAIGVANMAKVVMDELRRKKSIAKSTKA